ncbi:hypothetical protein Tco_1530136 [Tanacetum coccineum]
MCVAGVIQTLEAKERHPINQRARHSLEPVSCLLALLYQRLKDVLGPFQKHIQRLVIIESLGPIGQQLSVATEANASSSRTPDGGAVALQTYGESEKLDISRNLLSGDCDTSNATSSAHQGGQGTAFGDDHNKKKLAYRHTIIA